MPCKTELAVRGGGRRRVGAAWTGVNNVDNGGRVSSSGVFGTVCTKHTQTHQELIYTGTPDTPGTSTGYSAKVSLITQCGLVQKSKDSSPQKHQHASSWLSEHKHTEVRAPHTVYRLDEFRCTTS